MEGVREFFVDGEDVWCASADGVERLAEGSPLVQGLVERVQGLYPKAYAALAETYAKSAANVPYFRFLVARRFCKCNFGRLDRTQADVGRGGGFCFEDVPCPLRGECKLEGVVCRPELETRLSAAERRVMELVTAGRSNAEIAEELYLSPNTVKRHVAAAYEKTGSRNRAEFTAYATRHNLFHN